MREEHELEVLEQYDLKINSTRRIRGAFFCDTNEGTMLLKETKISERRAPFLFHVQSYLEKKGVCTDTPVFTRDGKLLVTSPDGNVYMLKKWYQGRDCDVRQSWDIARAAGALAALHAETEDASGWLNEEGCCEYPIPTGKNPASEIVRRNRELKKVRAFVRTRVTKNRFEYLFLSSFEKMFRIAQEVLERMEESECLQLYNDSMKRMSLAHGDYNYHNLIMLREGEAITDFEHMRVDIQAQDLYYFLRKAMEKNQWKQKTGQKILESYEKIRKLSGREMEYIGLCLAYPEKFWKSAGRYYHSNKAWLSDKSVEKLETAVQQSDERYRFLKDCFGIKFE